MGFFKSVKKKLSLFKRQVQKILPRELTDNPEIVAAFIIGGNIPFGQTQQSLFARGASSVGNLFSDPKSYFTNLNNTISPSFLKLFNIFFCNHTLIINNSKIIIYTLLLSFYLFRLCLFLTRY